MNRKLKLSLSFMWVLITYVTAFGQSDSNAHRYNASIQLSVGLSMPNNSCMFYQYSNTGSEIILSATVPIKHKQYGIIGILSWETNATNSEEYYGQLQQGGNYQLYSALAGPYIKFPVRKISINCRVLCGMLNFNIPEIIYSGQDGISSPNYAAVKGTWVTPSKSISSFAMDFGTGIIFNSSSKFFFALNIDLFYSGLNGGFNPTTQFTEFYTKQVSYEQYSFQYDALYIFIPSVGLGYKL